MSEHKKNAEANMSYLKGIPKQRKKGSESVTRKASEWHIALSSQILAQGNLTDQVGDDWLNSLKQDSKEFLETRVGTRLERLRRESITKQGIEVTIDKLFSYLQVFMYEFNKVAAGTDLHVSGTISGDVTEVTRYNKFREAEETRTYFRARFSTRIYSLVIRGRDKTIDFYLLPVNRAMALSLMENEYSPLATIEIKVDEEGIMWRSLTADFSATSLDNLCALLFKQLVEQTRSAISGEGKPQS